MAIKPDWPIVVKIYLIPPTMEEAALRSLHKAIVRSVANSLPTGAVSGEEDFLTLFPGDRMSYGNDGSEFYIEIILRRNSSVSRDRAWFALHHVEETLRKSFPKANIQGVVLEATTLF